MDLPQWDPSAAGSTEPEILLYRSNLLGSDLRVTNFAGGNTSAKVRAPDPLTGEEVDVLWVKGSGGDLGSMGIDGFATFYLDKLHALQRLYRGLEHEDEMVGYLPHCVFGNNPRPGSIDTPLHAFVPFRHVDHMHPDSVIAIAAAKDGERLTEEIFEGQLAWLPWQRPGFDLGLRIGEKATEREGLRGIVLGGHGLFTWGETGEQCYRNTIEIIERATAFLDGKKSSVAFGGKARESLAPDARAELWQSLLPELRGALSPLRLKVAHVHDSPDVLEFLEGARFEELAALGTSCPDHFLRTKIRPLVVPFDPAAGAAASAAQVPALVAQYVEDYSAYYERCKRADSPALRDPYPVVVLVPGAGMVSFAADKKTARIAGEFYINAIHVMRGATDVSEYVGLPEQEAFDIEYWQLEEAKLRRMPAPKALAGKVAVVTGAGGGIGGATVARFLAEGACVVLTDIAPEALEARRAEFAAQFGEDFVRAQACDVTKESDVIALFDYATREFGGVDVTVACAGIASSAPIEETTLELWEKNQSVLSTGYFLVSREAFKVMKRQQVPSSIVFVASKNALAASKNASAYCTAKAAELHLARCLALEGAEHGIRVNVVNPDAVLQGSRIWDGEWRAQRAASYGITEEELEDHYKARSLLGRSVLPEDIAEAVFFFASDASAKSTGNVVNVDAGNAQSFPR